jgi:hypothetical protein
MIHLLFINQLADSVMALNSYYLKLAIGALVVLSPFLLANRDGLANLWDRICDTFSYLLFNQVSVEITTEYMSYFSSWTINRTIYGNNHKLILAILSHISQYRDQNRSSRVEYIFNDDGIGYDEQSQAESDNRDQGKQLKERIHIKPTSRFRLPPPYQHLSVQYREHLRDGEKKQSKTETLKITTTKQHVSDIDKFLSSCYQRYCDLINNRAVSKRYLLLNCYDNDKLVCKPIEIHLHTTFDKIFFPQKKKLIKTLDNFLNRKSASPIYGKFSLLMYGPPGTGKTSVIKAIANYTDRNIHYVKLSSIKTFQDALDVIFSDSKNHVVSRNFDQSIGVRQKIVVLEDIDADCKSTHQRQQLPDRSKNPDSKLSFENQLCNAVMMANQETSPSSGLNLSDILQLLDGIVEVEGLMLIATTNHIGKLDPALVRKGRFTFLLEMEKIGPAETTEMIQYYYQHSPDRSSPKRCQEIVDRFKKRSVNPSELEYAIQQDLLGNSEPLEQL